MRGGRAARPSAAGRTCHTPRTARGAARRSAEVARHEHLRQIADPAPSSAATSPASSRHRSTADTGSRTGDEQRSVTVPAARARRRARTAGRPRRGSRARSRPAGPRCGSSSSGAARRRVSARPTRRGRGTRSPSRCSARLPRARRPYPARARRANSMFSCGSHSTRRAGRDVESHALARAGPPRCTARGAGRGEEHLRPAPGPQLELQLVAAGDAAGRMHDDRVAGRVALGIERLLHDERPVVAPRREHGARAAALVRQRERGAPPGCSDRLSAAHVRLIPPATPGRRPDPCRRRGRAR